MNRLLALSLVLLIISCGGGGSSSPAESGSQASSSTSNSSNSSSNSSNSTSTSSSQDSAANIINQTGCTPLVTGSNEADNDADGVINLLRRYQLRLSLLPKVYIPFDLLCLLLNLENLR